MMCRNEESAEVKSKYSWDLRSACPSPGGRQTSSYEDEQIYYSILPKIAFLDLRLNMLLQPACISTKDFMKALPKTHTPFLPLLFSRI